MTIIIRDRFALRRGTAAAWTSVNPVLADGEEGYETDTGRRKVGDGHTAWVSLPYSGVLAPAVALTAGQLYSVDASGNTVAANPTGSSELGYAENNTGTTQTGISTATDITGCSIAPGASTRPVYLSAQATLSPTSGGTSSTVSLTLVEVSNGVDTAITLLASIPSPGTAWASVVIPLTRLAASTARTRTFKLQASTSTGTITVRNGSFNYRSSILAMAG